MIAGHFGLAAGVKKIAPRLPLWALLLSTFWLDVIFLALAAVGLESVTPINPAQPSYGQVTIHAFYTHSLLGAALIAGLTGWAAGRKWGARGGRVIAGVVFSHWLLDLLVHRPDLPILPGNLGSLPLLGFGLWQIPAASAALELALVLAGAYIYFRSAIDTTRIHPAISKNQRRQAQIAGTVTAGLLLLVWAADLFSI